MSRTLVDKKRHYGTLARPTRSRFIHADSSSTTHAQGRA